MSARSASEGSQQQPNWTGLINESVHTSDDKDIGDIQAVNRDFVVVKRGFRDTHYYYIPAAMIEGWDGNVLWLTISEDDVKRNYEKNNPPDPSRYYTHARTTIQSPPYDMAKLPYLRVLESRYAEPTYPDFNPEAPVVYKCDLCDSTLRAEEDLSNHIITTHGRVIPTVGTAQVASSSVVDWDSIVHKNARSKDRVAVGNVGAVTDSSVVILRGPGREFIVPKTHVEKFNGAEVMLDLPYNEIEASYKRIVD